MGDALRLVAHLSSPLAGDAPHLDSLLIYVACRMAGKAAEPGYKVDRRYPVADTSDIVIPLLRRRVGSWNIAAATSPILAAPTSDTVEHVAKRIGVEHSDLLAVAERKVVTTTNAWTKSYRLPLRVRRVDRVAWLCVGNRREILKAMRYVTAIGKKIADGYGRVGKWECERIGGPPHDRWPWWIDSEGGAVLMRPLPEGDWPSFVGARRDYGACCDPYWHPSRYGEVVVPC